MGCSPRQHVVPEHEASALSLSPGLTIGHQPPGSHVREGEGFRQAEWKLCTVCSSPVRTVWGHCPKCLSTHSGVTLQALRGHPAGDSTPRSSLGTPRHYDTANSDYRTSMMPVPAAGTAPEKGIRIIDDISSTLSHLLNGKPHGAQTQRAPATQHHSLTPRGAQTHRAPLTNHSNASRPPLYSSGGDGNDAPSPPHALGPMFPAPSYISRQHRLNELLPKLQGNHRGSEQHSGRARPPSSKDPGELERQRAASTLWTQAYKEWREQVRVTQISESPGTSSSHTLASSISGYTILSKAPHAAAGAASPRKEGWGWGGGSMVPIPSLPSSANQSLASLSLSPSPPRPPSPPPSFTSPGDGTCSRRHVQSSRTRRTPPSPQIPAPKSLSSWHSTAEEDSAVSSDDVRRRISSSTPYHISSHSRERWGVEGGGGTERVGGGGIERRQGWHTAVEQIRVRGVKPPRTPSPESFGGFSSGSGGSGGDGGGGGGGGGQGMDGEEDCMNGRGGGLHTQAQQRTNGLSHVHPRTVEFFQVSLSKFCFCKNNKRIITYLINICLHVCERERERERECACVYIHVYVHMHAYIYIFVYVCVYINLIYMYVYIYMYI